MTLQFWNVIVTMHRRIAGIDATIALMTIAETIVMTMVFALVMKMIVTVIVNTMIKIYTNC